MKETPRQANYRHVKYLGSKKHLLLEISQNQLELFVARKNHASWGLIYKNTHLEFVGNYQNIFEK